MKNLALTPVMLVVVFVTAFVLVGGPILFVADLLGLSDEAGMFGAAIGTIGLLAYMKAKEAA
jgi:hypothetical protein